MNFENLFPMPEMLNEPDPMEVTVDAAQWVRDRIKNGQRRLLVVFRDWDPPSPMVDHPDDGDLRVLRPIEAACIWTRTATQAASWAGLRDVEVEAVLITRDVPISAMWRVGYVASHKGCQVWHQTRG